MKTLILVCSYHHRNTEKLARHVAMVLDAEVAPPEAIDAKRLSEYDLIGFASGIYNAKHHGKLVKFAEALPLEYGKKAFILSTDGMPRALMRSEAALLKKQRKDHAALREILQAKGYDVVGEFGCAGLDTNSFLKLFGGVNKGRPNDADLAKAAKFARELYRANA